MTIDPPPIPVPGAAVRAEARLTSVSRVLTFGVAALDAADVASVAHVASITLPPRAWPPDAPSVALACDPARLPFVEAMFDVALVALDLAQPQAFLRELWRVLAPAGVLIIAVPGWLAAIRDPRSALSSRHHSRASLARLLDAAMFEVAAERRTGGWHVVRAVKRDGLAPVGRVAAAIGDPVAG